MTNSLAASALEGKVSRRDQNCCTSRRRPAAHRRLSDSKSLLEAVAPPRDPALLAKLTTTREAIAKARATHDIGLANQPPTSFAHLAGGFANLTTPAGVSACVVCEPDKVWFKGAQCRPPGR